MAEYEAFGSLGEHREPLGGAEDLLEAVAKTAVKILWVHCKVINHYYGGRNFIHVIRSNV